MKKAYLLFLLLMLCINTPTKAKDASRRTISLSGTWTFCTDEQNAGITQQFWKKTFTDNVLLPGTTDTNRKGKKNNKKNETTYLSRRYTYQGPAWYSRDVVIPKDWKDKHVVLFLERTRPSMMWIDGHYVGACNSISTPHRYDISKYSTPGRHRITIRVDNGESIPSQIRSSSHACTESTQTNWNGIIGRMELQATNRLYIEYVKTYPSVETRSIRLRIKLSDASGIGNRRIDISAKSFNSPKSHKAGTTTLQLEEGRKEYELTYRLGDDAQLWSEASPALYRLKVSIVGVDEQETTFGLREFKASGSHFFINGNKTFLRGKHDACVFPLTAHTAMTVKEWRRYLRTCRQYGINHCRFHSWCPPQACFEAADLEGIYLQPELPIWGSFKKENTDLMDFLMNEGTSIQEEYSNHASFVLFALGNELSGDIKIMKDFVEKFRQKEDRHLYTYGSNIFLGSRGHIPGEDFLVTCRTGTGDKYSTHVRASFSFADAEEGGYLNNTYPNTEMNFDKAASLSAVPVIGHETGQFQTYPDYREIKKYKGVLAPWNMETFRKRLYDAGMGRQAKDFFKASGAWSVELYRADIEMNLRSDGMSGFQLLDLQDYPGQGSAYVGILDAFMDSKGLIKPKKWREFCAEVVPLFVMKKYCWSGQDTFCGEMKIANYGEKQLVGKQLSWTLKNGQKVIAKGTSVIPEGLGLLSCGDIRLPLPDIDKACKAQLSLEIEGTPYRNSYPIWIYPASKKADTEGIMISHELDDKTLARLKQGGKVLLMPRRDKCRDVTVEGLFQTDYWNYRMFKSICDNIKKKASPGTLGILTDPEHGIFASFPTESHTNWQWYPIIKNSYPLIIDRLPQNYRPIVQVIDNIERNHKLGLIMEFSVDGGRLLLCMADLDAAKNTPEGFQLYASILEYMHTPAFDPNFSLSSTSLMELLSKQAHSDKIDTLNNISYD